MMDFPASRMALCLVDKVWIRGENSRLWFYLPFWLPGLKILDQHSLTCSSSWVQTRQLVRCCWNAICSPPWPIDGHGRSCQCHLCHWIVPLHQTQTDTLLLLGSHPTLECLEAGSKIMSKIYIAIHPQCVFENVIHCNMHRLRCSANQSMPAWNMVNFRIGNYVTFHFLVPLSSLTQVY